ncbi:Cruciform DNA binding protein [Rhizina undulata]
MSGTFVFIWSRPATEVYVTGTFDDWSKKTKLEKEGEKFVAKVELPVEKTFYKYVVDGDWVTDRESPIEADEGGFENNVLYPKDITVDTQPESEDMSEAVISTAAPDTTTAELASGVPVETNGEVKDATISTVTPEATTVKLASEVPVEKPLGADEPSGLPETPADEAAYPASEEKEELGEFSVKPLPASATGSNPITLAPGEPVPKELTTQSVDANVKLDKESYEKADASNLGVAGAPVLPQVITLAQGDEGRGPLDLSTIIGAVIPENSVPALETSKEESAAVPDIVKESQESAHVPPEASAIPDVVEHKKEVEEELKSEVPVAPAASEETVAAPAAVADVPEIVQESQAEAHVAPEASEVPEAVEAKKEVEEELKKDIPEAAPIAEASVVDQAKTAAEETPLPTETIPAAAASEPIKPVESVPEIVKESQAEAHVAPEASETPEAVEAKKEVEEELLQEVKPVESVPEIVKESQAEAHVAPEASETPEAVEAKKEVEEELLQEVKPVESVPIETPVELNGAPLEAQKEETASVEITKEEELPVIAPLEIRKTELPVTETSSLVAEETAPAPITAESSNTVITTTTEDSDSSSKNSTEIVHGSSSNESSPSKRKRRSFFMVIKDKLHDLLGGSTSSGTAKEPKDKGKTKEDDSS